MIAVGGWLVSIVPEGVFFRRDKKHMAFCQWMDERQAISQQLSEGAFEQSGTMVESRIVAIRKQSKP